MKQTPVSGDIALCDTRRISNVFTLSKDGTETLWSNLTREKHFVGLYIFSPNASAIWAIYYNNLLTFRKTVCSIYWKYRVIVFSDYLVDGLFFALDEVSAFWLMYGAISVSRVLNACTLTSTLFLILSWLYGWPRTSFLSSAVIGQCYMTRLKQVTLKHVNVNFW